MQQISPKGVYTLIQPGREGGPLRFVQEMDIWQNYRMVYAYIRVRSREWDAPPKLQDIIIFIIIHVKTKTAHILLDLTHQMSPGIITFSKSSRHDQLSFWSSFNSGVSMFRG